MKQALYATLAFVLSLPALFAQNTVADFIGKYKQEKGFTFAYLSKDLYENATKFDVKEKDWKKLQQVVSDMGSLSILAAENLKNAKSVYEEAQNVVKKTDLEELLTVRDGNDKVQIWAKDETDNISELLMLVGDAEAFVLISFSGKFKLSNIGALAEMLDAEQSVDLAKTAAAVAAPFSISPNPVTDQFMLQYENEENDTPALLSIMDANGRLIKTIKTSNLNLQTLQIGDVPQGNYWVQLKTEQGKVGVRQIVVIKQP